VLITMLPGDVVECSGLVQPLLVSKPAVVVTSCYGERFWAAVPSWLARIRSITELPVEIVSLDGRTWKAPHVRTINFTPGRVLEYGSGDRERTEHIVSRLEEGRICLQIDLDVYLKRDVDPIVGLPYDFIVSRAFRFPEDIVARLGFVACTGFYVAKPSALPLLRHLYSRLREGLVLDQAELNACLVESEWHNETVELLGFQGVADVCECRGVKICVLPKEVIARDDDLETSWFGNHFRTLLAKA
jgi:hypothetical protein